MVRMQHRRLVALSGVCACAMVVLRGDEWAGAGPTRGSRAWGATAALVRKVAASTSERGRTPIRALAPFEIVAAGFEALAGVAVEADGAVLVTDREAGTLTRIDAAGRRRVLLDDLHGPTGVAVDAAGGVLVIDQAGSLLLRLAPDGRVTVVTAALRQARAVAVGPDGRVWLSLRRATGRGDDDDVNDDDDNDDRSFRGAGAPGSRKLGAGRWGPTTRPVRQSSGSMVSVSNHRQARGALSSSSLDQARDDPEALEGSKGASGATRAGARSHARVLRMVPVGAPRVEKSRSGAEDVIARVDESGTLISFASGFMGVQGLAVDHAAVYVVMARLASERGPQRGSRAGGPERGRQRTTLVRIPVRADGSAGVVEARLRNAPRRPRGVAVDAAGDVFIGGTADGRVAARGAGNPAPRQALGVLSWSKDASGATRAGVGALRVKDGRVAARGAGGPALRQALGVLGWSKDASGATRAGVGAPRVINDDDDDDDDEFDDDNDDDEAAGVILKLQTEARVGTFATGLRHPVALAFAPNGDLVAVEKDEPGRVLRFRAPPPPMPVAPGFTNQSPLALAGTAAAGARVSVVRAAARGTLLGSVVADAVTGAFTLPVPLDPNATNELTAVATGAGGAGLVSAPTTVRVVHDDLPPVLTVIEPLPGLHAREQIVVSARAEDERSGVAALRWSVDGTEVVRLDNPAPAEPFVAVRTLATAALAEGPHTIGVTVADRAGNETVAGVPIVVDRTPPETIIVRGPAAEIAERAATFTVSGTDAWSAPEQLDFAWRLDEGPWSAFDATAVIEVSGLAPGAHRFEVRARDRAGNEDPTPAVQTFTVTALRVRILDPVPGAVVTTRSVWVRGTVESGGGEVGVTILLPPELRTLLLLNALPAATVAGTFAVEVPLTESTTTLSVAAMDASGVTARDQVAISVQPPLSEPRTGFEAFPAAGLAPHTVNFDAPAREGMRVALDLESDGSVEFEGATLTGQTFVLTRPAVYVATLRVMTEDGQRFTSRTVVEVYDRAALEARLQAAWQGFKQALRTGDVARAVSFVHSDRRARWHEYFSQFTPDLFALTDTVFTDLTLLKVVPGGAECEMMREVDSLPYSFPISFVIDADGHWRLWQF